MIIELLKKLEDIKQDIEKLGNELIKTKEQKLQKYTNDANDDFKRFFQEKGFSVQGSNGNIIASYGDLSATLKHDNPIEIYLAGYYLIDITLRLPSKVEHPIAIAPCRFDYHRQGVPYSINEEDEKIRCQIEQEQQYLKEFTAWVYEYPSMPWSFKIKQDKRIVNPYDLYGGEGYSSLYELLSSIVK